MELIETPPKGSGPSVLVLGATGQVGRQVLAAIRRYPKPLLAVSASRTNADPHRRFDLALADTVDLLISDVAPEHVILTAAATNVAWCEANPGGSYQINVDGIRAAAVAARRVGASLTFISTDYVFDGTNGPYPEDAATNPINVYGAHKLEAENAVLSAHSGNLVIRTCQVFGDDPRRANFVLRIVDQLRSGQAVSAAVDLFGTPTYAPDLAKGLIDLTIGGAAGIWHLAGDEFLSRYGLATMTAAAFGLPPGAVAKVSAAELEDPVRRPRLAGLRNARAAAEGLTLVTPLKAALAALAAEEEPR